MSHTNEALVTSVTLAHAPACQYRPDPASGVVRTPAAAEQADAHSGKRATDAEAIIKNLVNQYFRCSTSMSGIFLCW